MFIKNTHSYSVPRLLTLSYARQTRGRRFSRTSSTWKGRQASEHVTNQDHNHNIHAEASNKGQKAREQDQAGQTQEKQSAATSQRDIGGLAKQVQQEKGKKDAGLGLQDERGGKSKADIISERQANLPLPEEPPVASDWNSADARTVNVSAGTVESNFSPDSAASESGLGEPATKSATKTLDSTDTSETGRQAKEGVEEVPEDATKGEIIDKRKADLPLPEEPPVASDWNSADATKVNIDS